MSGDSALTLFVLASGTGTAVALGGTATLTGTGVAFNDEDSGDAFGTVVVDFQGHTVSYRTTRWQTLPPRQTELHAVVVRRTVGARLGQTQVRLDGADLVAETPAPDTLSLPQLTNTALCLGVAVAVGDVLTGHVYALGVWNSVLSDADVLAVEAWARKAIARTADTRGILVGSGAAVTVSTTLAQEFDVDRICRRAIQLAGLLDATQGTDSPSWTARSAMARDFLEAEVEHLQALGILQRARDFYDLDIVDGTGTYTLPTSTLEIFGVAMFSAD